jgi:GxxExxY protein
MSLLHQKITEQVIKGFYIVYNELGFGFLEKVYHNALLIELRRWDFPMKVRNESW